jgi:endonuclease/exonuclease/phosphatase family metal-dependent hydrolase
MEEIETGSFVSGSFARVRPEILRVVSWNINRGLHLNAVIDFLADSSADLILLQEADIGARRTQWRNTPREIAQALQMNYVFGREFQELGQGRANSPAHHGQATLSRFPISHPSLLRFRCQSGFWRPQWFIPPLQAFQRRLGARIALICEIRIHGRTLITYNAHLESRGNDELRSDQLFEVLTEIRRYSRDANVLVAGDFNFDASSGSVAGIIADAQLDTPLTLLGGCPTATTRRHCKSAAIDWILTSKRLVVTSPEIHAAIEASDHYPISIQIEFRGGRTEG